MRRPPVLVLLAAIVAVNVLLLLRFAGGCSVPQRSGADDSFPPTVLLISIDGFRWDYLDLHEAPTLERLASQGVRARRLIPAFPTKTFPNHYTTVTGLYPEHHGIVANSMYDPRLDASFSLSNREAVQDARWWGGEPIWVTAEQQGQRTAAFFWPGSEAPIKGVRPTYWMPYDGDIGGADRVDQVLAWLDLPAAHRPTFITLYFSDVDDAGHTTGPTSSETAEAVRRVDRHLARLVDGLEQRRLLDQVNLIVVSDHGMAPTSSERLVVLDEYIDLDAVRIIDYSPVLMLYADEGAEDRVLEGLRSAPHLSVYRKDEVPERLHFNDHYRIPPLIAIADEGWSIGTRAALERRPTRYDGGSHGYDNRAETMGALFVARGPAFREGVVVDSLANVDLYELMTTILGLEPAPNDGRFERVAPVLATVPAR